MQNINRLLFIILLVQFSFEVCSCREDEAHNANEEDEQNNCIMNLGPMTIHSIDELNQIQGNINSHENETGYSLLEMNYLQLVDLRYPLLSTAYAYYPRIKKLSNGEYLLIYQKHSVASNIFYTLSKDLQNWKNCGALFSSYETVNGGGEIDTRCFSTCDAVVLNSGDILAFVSYRDNQGYRYYPDHNGIMMRRSRDNGITWEDEQSIYSGNNWEPYGLQLSSSEIHVYFTDNDPKIGDSGTSLLRSTDNGMTWTSQRHIIRQNSGIAIDDSGEDIFTDQMACARELNGTNKIAVSLESRFINTYYLSMAWSDDNWAETLTGTMEGPKERVSNFFEGAGPYLNQFRSGETVLSCNVSKIFNLFVGNAEASNFDDVPAYKPFPGTKGVWGATEIISDHTIVGVIRNAVESDNNGIMVASFKLNHRINAPLTSIKVDGGNNDWEAVDDALFIGSDSETQASFRFAHNANNLYVLIECLNQNITSYNTLSLMFHDASSEKSAHKIDISPDINNNCFSSSSSNIKMGAYVKGSMSSNNDKDTGFLIELSIPIEDIPVVNNRFVFNAILRDKSVSDTFTGLTNNNYSKWLQVNLN